MKIFAAGISTETNTFANIPTNLEDFVIARGHIGGDKPRSALDLQPWRQMAAERGHTFCAGLCAWAQPGGTTVRSSYETLRGELLADLFAAMPVDIVLLHLHGAMVADGYDDCEEDIIQHVRSIAGPTAVIGVELDLHCHLSNSKISAADVVVLYKEYPHTDVNERACEVFNLSLATKQGLVQPRMTLLDCHMLGLYPTTRQPMRGFVDALTSMQGRNGVLSISFGHGFPFADVAHMGAKLLVVTDNNEPLAHEIAKELHAHLNSIRDQVGFESIALPLDQAMSKAMGNSARPAVIADQSDNPGGGAPGDSTFALRWLLDNQVDDAGIAILHDPEVVKLASKAGVGARLSVRLGGKTGPMSGDPVDVTGTVLALKQNHKEYLAQQSGDPWCFPAGNVAVLRCDGVDVVIGSQRCQCVTPAIFSDLGIDPTRKRLLVIKSMQHFQEGFASIAADIIYMAAPGAVSPDLRQIRYRRFSPSRHYPFSQSPG